MQAQVPAPSKPTKLYCLDVDGFLLASVCLARDEGRSLTGTLITFVEMLQGDDAHFFTDVDAERNRRDALQVLFRRKVLHAVFDYGTPEEAEIARDFLNALSDAVAVCLKRVSCGDPEAIKLRGREAIKLWVDAFLGLAPGGARLAPELAGLLHPLEAYPGWALVTTPAIRGQLTAIMADPDVHVSVITNGEANTREALCALFEGTGLDTVQETYWSMPPKSGEAAQAHQAFINTLKDKPEGSVMARHIRALYPLKRTCSGQLPRWAYKGARALELLRQCRPEGMPIERVVVGDDQEDNLRVIREVLQAAYPGLPCVGYQTLAELAPPPSPLALSGVACSSVAPVPEAGCAKKGLPPGLGCFGSASASSPSPEVRYSRRGLRDQACGFFSPEPQMPAQRALPRGGSSSVTGMEGLSLG